MGRWVTNLESEESMAKAVAAAKVTAVDAPPGPAKRAAEAALHIARYRQADVAKTYRAIEMEHGGRVSIGPPMATDHRTAEEIAADGIIGIYLEGAGTGP